MTSTPSGSHPERASSTPGERRRASRLRLHLPMFVRGVDARGQEFLDLAKTLNISGVGAALATARPVTVGDLVTLTIPAPPPSPSGMLPAPSPPIQARIRRRQSAGDVYIYAVEFLKPLD